MIKFLVGSYQPCVKVCSIDLLNRRQILIVDSNPAGINNKFPITTCPNVAGFYFRNIELVKGYHYAGARSQCGEVQVKAVVVNVSLTDDGDIAVLILYLVPDVGGSKVMVDRPGGICQTLRMHIKVCAAGKRIPSLKVTNLQVAKQACVFENKLSNTRVSREIIDRLGKHQCAKQLQVT